jgi:hypothetical protein
MRDVIVRCNMNYYYSSAIDRYLQIYDAQYVLAVNFKLGKQTLH